MKVTRRAGPVQWPYPHIRSTTEQVAGSFVNRVVVTCAGCDKPHTFPRFPPDMASQYLTQRGWVDPLNSRKARCPECVAADRAAKSEKEVTPMPKPSPAAREAAPDPKLAVVAVAEAPRTPTREDNRRIHDRIDEYWNGELGCYLGVYSDAGIALQLDMPRAWVAAVRDQFFGPDTNEEKRAAPAKLVEYEKRLKAAEDGLIAKASEVEALRAEVRAYLDSLGKAA